MATEESKAVLEKAKLKEDYRLVLQTLDRICKQLELQARFLEVLQKQTDQSQAEQAKQAKQAEMKTREKEYRELWENFKRDQAEQEAEQVMSQTEQDEGDCAWGKTKKDTL